MTVTADQVGPKFDILIATRDGSTLPCLGRPPQRTSLPVSQCAYMCSTQGQAGQHESTELQRKATLTSLASQQETDRQFDAWPQVTQGDWSGGMSQRVFSGGQNQPSRYWDGLGVIWPITDYLPQQAVVATPEQSETGALMQVAGNGATGGIMFTTGNNLQSYAWAYMQNSAPQHNILAIRTPNFLRKIDPIPGSVAGTPYRSDAATIGIDYAFGLGLLWLAAVQAGGNVLVNGYVDGAPPIVATTTTITSAGVGNGVPNVRIATGRAGGKDYLAVLHLGTTVPFALVPLIDLFDVTGNTVFGALAQIPVGSVGATSPFTRIQQIEFQGDNLIYAVISGQRGYLVQFSIAAQVQSVIAEFPNTTNLLFCPIAGGIFVLAANETAIAGQGNTVDMYLYQGGQLQHIGPIQVQSGTVQASNSIAGETEPVAFGPYAVFTIYYRPQSQTTTSAQVFAFDVLRGRLFKMADIGGYDILLGAFAGRRMAVASPVQLPVGANTLAAQWMAGPPVLGPNHVAGQDVSNVQPLLMGVSSGGNFGTPFLQQGVQVVSSVIDLTSSQPKLFRQIVAGIAKPGLLSDGTATVQLDVWLDQDPAALNATPDFTTGPVSSTLGGGALGQVRFKLLINTVATKLVYRATTVGPTVNLTPAVKLVTVAVQTATGWNLDYFLDLSKTARTNGGSSFAYQEQGLDELQAYNFLRQLWRLRGGECRVTLPNGDSYDGLLQLIDGESPKPYGANFLGGGDTFQQIVNIKIREDV